MQWSKLLATILTMSPMDGWSQELTASNSVPVRVVDGDTLEIGEVITELQWIDAPEPMQHCLHKDSWWPCGQMATIALWQMVRGENVNCVSTERIGDGLYEGICLVAETNLNVEMVEQGLAFRSPDAPWGSDVDPPIEYEGVFGIREPLMPDALVVAEQRAKKARRGIWSGLVVPPWDWRNGKRLVAAPCNQSIVIALWNWLRGGPGCF